jgi:hypothetical protein
MIMEKSVEWLAGETEVLGENLPQCRFVHHYTTEDSYVGHHIYTDVCSRAIIPRLKRNQFNF